MSYVPQLSANPAPAAIRAPATGLAGAAICTDTARSAKLAAHPAQARAMPPIDAPRPRRPSEATPYAPTAATRPQALLFAGPKRFFR